MTHSELAAFLLRYIRQSLTRIIFHSERIEARQEFLERKYMELYSDCLNDIGDPYVGHILKIYNVGCKNKMPLDLILEEMERYRISLINLLENKAEILESLRCNPLVYKKETKIKLKCLIRFLGKLNMITGLYKYIMLECPLSVLSDPTIFFKPDASEKKVPENKKERRIIYPEEMTSHEAAEFLNTTVDNLYNLTSSREIPHFKRGRKLVFKYSELKAWKLKKVASIEELNSIAANYTLTKNANTTSRKNRH
jgi:excisionase family DNA binding protein